MSLSKVTSLTNIQNRHSPFFTKQNKRAALVNHSKGPWKTALLSLSLTRNIENSKVLSQNNLQSATIGVLKSTWARHSFCAFNNDQEICFSLSFPAQHKPMQSFVFCNIIQSRMEEHFRKPHCSQGCWAVKWAISIGLALSFLLHCTTETLTPQIQLLHHFDIAEHVVWGGGLGNQI